MTVGNGAGPAMSTDELRSAVRAVLREVLPAGVSDRTQSDSDPVASAERQRIETVSIRNDSDLDALVSRVASLCEDPEVRAGLRAGRRGFRLSAGAPAAEQRGPELRVESGAVTERRVKQAASEGARLIVGRKAVLTPLARERAQALGVVVERER